MTDNGWSAPGSDSPGHSAPPPQYGQPGPQYGAPQYGAPQYGAPQYGAPGPMSPIGGMPLAPRPGVIPLRPLTISDIYEGTMRTIRGNPGATLGLSLLVAVVITLPAVALTIALDHFDPGSPETRDVLQYLSTDGYTVVQSIGTLFLTGMLCVVVAEAVLGRRVSIGQSWAKVKGRIWALIGVSLLTLLIVLSPLIVMGLLIAGLVVSIGDGGGGAVAGVVVLALFVFFVALGVMAYLWIKLHFAVPVTVLERQGPIASIKRSWELTRFQWWRIFGILLLTAILVGIVTMILSVPAGIIAGVSLESDPEAQTIGLWATLGVQASSVVVMTLTSPFSAGVSSLLYIDQRIRKEALDVTLMAAAQQNPTP